MKRTVFFTAAVALLCLAGIISCPVENNGDTGKPVASIAVTTMPAKLEYHVGDAFDKTGMVVTAAYTDGTTGAVTGYTVQFDSSTAGSNKPVIITYGGKRTGFDVDILPAGVYMDRIAITTPPTKREYRLNETLNTAGMVVTAIYTDESTKAVTGWTTSALNSSSTGKKTITVTYSGKTATFDVTVIQWNGTLSPNAQRLLNYLNDMYGEVIISGQMDTSWTKNGTMDMIKRVFDDTGKYPALKGFDFIELPNSWGSYGRDQIDEAIEWWEGKNRMGTNSTVTTLLPDKPNIHGIVTFCWHWKPENTDFNANNTNFRIPMNNGALDKSSAAFQTIKSDLDKVAALLQMLKDRDIPVLWRPLHEAGGDGNYADSAGWFWWGASGATNAERAAACVALWEYMHDYFTNEKGLDNLIWVWNGQKSTWFPDPATVHIISYDAYTNSTNYKSSTFKTRFDSVKGTRPELNLIVALTENGGIPDPTWSKEQGILWSWFMTWNDSRNTDGETHKDNFWTGEYHNTETHKTYIYEHELVITLDELPDLTAYRLTD